MGFYDMHIYDVKMTLRDTFYGEPSVLYGEPQQDARALAALSHGVLNLRARNHQYYWYFFLKDDKDRDLVRFLLRRNGLRPEFHMSEYYVELRPAFRMRMSEISNSKHLMEFTKTLKDVYLNDVNVGPDVARYIDTIKTKLAERQVKKK